MSRLPRSETFDEHSTNIRWEIITAIRFRIHIGLRADSDTMAEHDDAMRSPDGESTDERCVERRDAWLAPIFLDESTDAYTETPQAQSQGPEEPSNVCNAAGAARISNKGYLSISFEAYLQLMDLVGRMIRPDKRGSIPKELPPILARLQFDLDHLVERVQHAFLSKNAACRFG